MSPRKQKTGDAPQADQPVRKRKTGITRSAPAADAPPAKIANDAGPATLIRVPLPVRWRDLDAFNHVNNSNFLTYIEEARLHWFGSLPGPWVSEDVAPLLAAVHLNYRRPIEWPGELVIELFVERLGTTSLTLGHRIVAAQDAAVLYSDGHSVLVWIDRHSGRPAPLPDVVRRTCEC